MPVSRIATAAAAAVAVALLVAGCGSSGTATPTLPTVPGTVTVTTTAVKTVRSTAEVTVTTQVTVTGVNVPPTQPPPAATPPDGFSDFGNGVYADFESDHNAFSCSDDQDYCWGIKVWAANGCPGGTAVKLSINRKGDTTEVGTVENSTTTALPAAEVKLSVVGTNTLPEGDYQALITEVRCT